MQIIYFTLIGAVVGSLIAWLARTLMDKSGVRARTACDACRRTLSWWEMIPIFSYLRLGGRCRTCGTEILIADWAMELIGAALFGIGAWRFTTHREFVWWILLATTTMLMFYIDVRWSIVPRSFAILVAFIALFAQITPQNTGVLLLTALLGSIFYFFLYTISRGQWVGDGDVGLGFILGAAVGDPTRLGLALLIAHVLGAIVAVTFIKTGIKKFGEALPMGVFMMPAMWIILLWGGWAH